MRTKLMLYCQKGFVPFNYMPVLCTAIYKALGEQVVCVSNLAFTSAYRTQKGEGFYMQDTHAQITICTMQDHRIDFSGFALGQDCYFSVISYEEESRQEFEPNEPLLMRTLSPVSVERKDEQGNVIYLSPDEPLFLDNLLDKAYKIYSKFFGQTLVYDYNKIGVKKVKKRLVSQGFIHVVGYEYELAFSIDEPRLLDVVLHAGAGGHIALGLGCVQVEKF